MRCIKISLLLTRVKRYNFMAHSILFYNIWCAWLQYNNAKWLEAIFKLRKGVLRLFWTPNPPTYIRTFSLHKARENCHFLDHPPTSTSLRNIKMAPKHIPNLSSNVVQCWWKGYYIRSISKFLTAKFRDINESEIL